MSDAAAVGLICGMLAYAAAAFGFYRNGVYRQRAEFCRQWERQADRYADQLAQLRKLAPDPAQVPAELAKLHEYMVETDRMALARATRHADRWRSEIPKPLRRRYGLDA